MLNGKQLKTVVDLVFLAREVDTHAESFIKMVGQGSVITLRAMLTTLLMAMVCFT